MSRLKDRTGETNIAKCGLEMKIIVYRNASDIDIRFSDGTIVTHREYKSFKNGSIKHPNINPINAYHIGEAIEYKGLKITIIAYRKARDIDVEFSNGYVATTSYARFKAKQFPPAAIHYMEKRKALNGMDMELIAFHAIKDVDIRFADGTIVEHKAYSAFRKGQIKHPGINHQRFDNRIGEKNIATNGQEMTIVAYRNAHDIDVMFSDGRLGTHKGYLEFKTGRISPDFVSPVGQINTSTCGMPMKIIAYNGACDVDVMFSDGVINRHRAMKQFRNGQIGHPYIGNQSTNTFYGVKVGRNPEFKMGKDTYYICTFPDGTKDICTPQEIMARQGIKPVF